MNTVEALDLLALGDGADEVAVRAAYRREIRRHHPDLAGSSEVNHRATILLVEAHELLLDELATSPTGTLSRPAPPTPPPGEASGTGPAADPTTAGRSGAPSDPSASTGHGTTADGTTADGTPPASVTDDGEGSITIALPADEAFAVLYEAAGQVGDVSFVDRQLAILEIIVRFEGGPSCSVVMTLQGRSNGTEIFCSMESIEAESAPPITPVMDALVDALQRELAAFDLE